MTESASPKKRKCIGCGAELPAGTPTDLCPKCLLKLAMETQPGPERTVVVSPSGPKSRALPQPGEQFGHYTVTRLLGVGGMGAVYEAQDLESGRRVALKILSHTLDSPEARERFLREGRLAASINHPNSVYIFGTEEIAGTPIIAMELVTGGTLQERVRARGPMPPGEAVDAVLQLIEGLEAARRIGILHRDIKPSNCFVAEDGSVKIGDFGLSISTALRTEPALTVTGAFLGTPAFCSPEQLRGEELNLRSDMYSVGATLFYLLTGRTPFEAQNMVQLLATVLEHRAPSPRQFRPDVPQGLAKVVLRCLEKQPEERFKTYADLAQALTPYSSTAPTPATFGLRFLAGLVDVAILCTAAVIMNVAVFGSPIAFVLQAMELSPMILAVVLGWIAMTILYYAIFEGLWGAAGGKMLCRLRVVGAGRNPPGMARAALRALIYVVPPFVPYWAIFGMNPKGYMSSSQLTQMFLGFSCYGIMALLFVTARRHNGFAAIQDLLTKTRVVSRAAFNVRPVVPARETPAPVESAATIGPYHVLQPLAESAGEKWFLAYDLKLLRKVWVRVVPPGTNPVPAALRSIGRIGRLRWLTGRRSAEESWDAFEALNGRPFVELIAKPQPWAEVRYWLHDLATEIGIAEKDGTLPHLGLERVWITGEGRAKLLDFPSPGLPANAGTENAKVSGSTVGSSQSFLTEIATAALAGPGNPAESGSTGEVALPLPMYARSFLRKLGQMASADAIAAALKPLLSRAAAVSRLRRAALVAGCVAFPLLALGGGFFALSFLHYISQKSPGLLDLSSVLQDRSSGRVWRTRNPEFPADRLFEIYIASHYRGLITNDSTWSSAFAFALIKGEARSFAEKSVADYPAPTASEIAEADSQISKYIPKEAPFAGKPPVWLPAMIMVGSLAVYVCIPAVIAALLFRGGLVLLIAGVTFVRRDGQPASRLRLFWRAALAWTPVLFAFIASIVTISREWYPGPWLALALVALLAAWSVGLSGRGLQDRLAGTWPVPR